MAHAEHWQKYPSPPERPLSERLQRGPTAQDDMTSAKTSPAPYLADKARGRAEDSTPVLN